MSTGALTASSTDTDFSESSDTGDDCDLVPDACTDPGPPSMGTPVPNYPVTMSPIVQIDSTVHCPVARQIADDEMLNLPNFYSVGFTYPDDGLGDLPDRPDGYGILIFTHGSGLVGNAYDDMLGAVASRGVIGASIVADFPADVGENSRKVRLLCVAEALLDNNIAWFGDDAMSGQIAFGGHSTGGLGSLLVSKLVIEQGLFPNHTLVGSLAVAPVTADASHELVTSVPVFFLTIQGSRDGDTSGGAFSHYDAVQGVKAANDVTGAGRKALVWAYDVTHSGWGGNSFGMCLPDAKEVALIDTYIGGFIEAAFYDDPDANELFFSAVQASPVIPPTVENNWPMPGDAQVFGTSSQRVDPSLDYHSWVIDQFENQNLSLSDSNLAVEFLFPNFDELADGGSPLFDNTHFTRVATVQLDEDIVGDFPNFIYWTLSCEARGALVSATSITFRIGFLREFTDAVLCTGEDYELPEIDMVFMTANDEIRIDVEDHAHLALPDSALEEDIVCNRPGAGDGCHSFDAMQATVRIPVAEVCQQGISLEDVVRIGLEFSSPTPNRFLIMDDLELRRVPGEPDVACRCN